MLSPKGQFSWTGLSMLCQVIKAIDVIIKGEIQLDWFINVMSGKAIDVITKGEIQLDWFNNVISG